MTQSNERLMLDSMEGIHGDITEIRVEIGKMAANFNHIKSSVDRLEESVLIGNGKPSLISRVGSLEEVNVGHKKIEDQIVSTVIKTLVPVVIVVLALAVVVVGGFSKYTFSVDTKTVVQELKKELKNEQNISGIVTDASTSGLRN